MREHQSAIIYVVLFIIGLLATLDVTKMSGGDYLENVGMFAHQKKKARITANLLKKLWN